MIEDYRIYTFDKKETILGFLEGMLLNALLAFLFYNSFYAMLPGMILVFLYRKEKRRILCRKRMRQMRIDLKEFLNTLIAALQTGRSMENAFCEAYRDMNGYIGKDTPFLQEIKRICAGIAVGGSLEKLLMEFSERSHIEELEYFAQVFSIGKRSGGNLVGIMKNTIRMIQERMDAEEEIYTVIAEKQFEFRIMCVIPVGIIGYLRIGAANLIHSLYGSVPGVVVMTVCLGIYGGCYIYGQRLLEIKD